MDPMVQGQLKEWILMLSTIGLGGWLLYLAAANRRRKQKNDMRKALLDKFSSAHDFAEFMQSPAGQKYVMSFADAVTSPRDSILNSIKTGFVLMFLGMGFLAGANGGWLAFRLGWISFLVGVGFLASAGVAFFLTQKTSLKEKE